MAGMIATASRAIVTGIGTVTVKLMGAKAATESASVTWSAARGARGARGAIAKGIVRGSETVTATATATVIGNENVRGRGRGRGKGIGRGIAGARGRGRRAWARWRSASRERP